MTKKGETFLELNLEDAVSFFNHAEELIYKYFSSVKKITLPILTHS